MIGPTGEVSTYLEDDGAGGRVELPMRLGPGQDPPCGVCPKVPAGRPKHWSHAAEWDPWVFGVLGWFAECRAVGDFGGPDPLMRRLARLLADDERRRDRAAFVGDVAAALAAKR